MSRAEYTAALGCFVLSLLSIGCGGPSGDTQPNVLVIISDDLNTHIGAYGSTQVHTPAIDSLASRSLRFDRAYCQTPICNGSRASLLTGLRPETIQVQTNQAHLFENLPDVITLPLFFERGGYWTAAAGKIFHHSGEDADLWDEQFSVPMEFSIPMEVFRATYKAEEGDGPEDRARARDEFLEPFLAAKDASFRPVVYGPTLLDDEDYQDGRNVRQVVDWLESAAFGTKPFFIMCGINSPHQPISAPQAYFDLYTPEQITFEPDPEGDVDDMPAMALSPRYETFGVPPGDDAMRREVIAAYYACISYTDAQVSRIVEALDRQDLWDNTIVVFMSDHGFHLGEHGMWSKGTLFEESTRVPMLVHAPGITRPGTHSGGVIELVDLFPTLAELAGLPQPPDQEGLSFAPLLGEPDRPWKKGAFNSIVRNLQYGRIGRSVRTPHWRYTEWMGKDGVMPELYDMENDPREHTNLAADPARAERIAELSELLAGGWEAALP